MFSSTKKFAITLTLVFLMNIILASALFYLFTEIDKKNGVILEIKRSLAVQEERIKSSKDLEKGLEENKSQLAKIESVFFDKTSILDFIRRLEYLAQKSGVELSLQNVNISEDAGKKPKFNVTLKGRFADIYLYLSLVESDYYRVSVERAYIQKIADKKLWADNWESGLEIRLLSFKQ